MRLYTRTGDDGTTGLFGGERVSKSDPRVCAYGDVDELNATLGLARAAAAPGLDDLTITILDHLQQHLFVIGADLATPLGLARATLAPTTPAHNTRLEKWIDDATAPVPPLREFILPGGSELAARLHVARTIARRAERAVVSLRAALPDAVSDAVLIYLNRTSDLLFALARLANHVRGVTDVTWRQSPR